MYRYSYSLLAFRAIFVLALGCGLSLPVLAATKTFDSTVPAAMRLIDVSDTTYEGYDIVVSGVTVTINGAHSFASLTVQNSGSVTHTPGLVGGMNLAISGNVLITAGSYIQADYTGYPGGQGPGRGATNTVNGGGGGSYGGSGGPSPVPAGAVYGDLRHPADSGSGGGIGYSSYVGGAGGGAIRLTVNGTLQVDGSIEASGQSVNRGGGGSGGGIYLVVNTVSGVGSISARGGYSSEYYGASGGGGGGGRIAIYYQTNNFAISQLSVGGSDSQNFGRAAAGTIFLKQATQANGDLWIQNDNNPNGIGTVIVYPDTFDNLNVISRGVLSPDYFGTLDLTVINKCFVDSVSSISASSRGYPGAQGQGVGQPDTTTNHGGGGGSFGGEGTAGSAPAGFVYGDIKDPVGLKNGTHLGSGGGSGWNNTYPGGSGGGAIRLIVSNVLRVDGSIETNGQSVNRGGGGSGGSIYIAVNTLEGAGFISARGGYSSEYYGPSGGGGGGGRIAVYYQTNNFPINQITAAGGGSSNYGTAAAGTVFLKSSLQANGDLSIQNDGANGIPTILIGSNIFDNVHIWREGTLGSPYGQILNLTVLGNCTIDSYMRADGRGNGAGKGPGAGSNAASGWGGAGGGYGGAGGSTGGGGIGGDAYGFLALPIDFTNPDVTMNFGSGGGTGESDIYTGGAGGGAIYLAVIGTLSINGQLTASGSNVTCGGAGAGGSLLVRAGMLTGSGTISANGGGSSSYYSIPAGGGGGGGRIALYYQTNNFTGSISASGGGGYRAGANGTVFMQQTSASNLTLTLAVSPKSLGGGQSSVGSITLSGPAPAGGLSIALNSGNTNAATVPSSVSIAEGQTSGIFPITAVSVAATQTSVITAQLWDRASSQTVSVTPWLASLRINPSSVLGGTNVTGTLTLNIPAPSGGLTVGLVSSDPGVNFPNGTMLTIPGGVTTQPFAVNIGSVSTAHTAMVTTSYLSEVQSATLALNPAGVQVLSVQAIPASVVGGASANGIVTLNGPAPIGGAIVTLVSADTAAATIPATLTIPAGQSSASFPITTYPVSGSRSVQINATLGATRFTTLTVRQPGVASLNLAPSSVTGGSNAVGIVTLEAASVVPITVTLSSGDSHAVPQGSFVIPAGQMNGSFLINTTSVTTQTVALITARANGIARSQGLTLTPPPTTATISGVITLDSIASNAAAQSVTFEFRPTTGGAKQTYMVALGTDGSFSLSKIPFAKYSVWIKGAKWLAQVVSVDATPGDVSGVSVTLPGGDADNNNTVDVLDFGILVNAYGTDSKVAGSGYDNNADFNCDGVVDVLDFGILVNNYGASGAP